MDLYARVNILAGRSVRLPRGKISDAITLDNDPVGRALSWVSQGADFIHVVDLDAAANRDYRNRDLIDRLIGEVKVPVQVAGGVRSQVEAARLIESGAWRVVMGTAAIEDQTMVYELCAKYPDHIAVSLDIRPNEELATRGWTQNSGRFLEEVLLEMASAGVAAFMISEAGRDALVEPPDNSMMRDALAIVEEPIIAAGGVRHLDDLRSLMALQKGGHRLSGVVVGREVTHGRFTLEQAKAVIAEGVTEKTIDQPVKVAPHIADAAEQFRLVAAECELAASEARTAAVRLMEMDVPKGSAHAFAAHGHLRKADGMLDDLATLHAERAVNQASPPA